MKLIDCFLLSKCYCGVLLFGIYELSLMNFLFGVFGLLIIIIWFLEVLNVRF